MTQDEYDVLEDQLLGKEKRARVALDAAEAQKKALGYELRVISDHLMGTPELGDRQQPIVMDGWGAVLSYERVRGGHTRG